MSAKHKYSCQVLPECTCGARPEPKSVTVTADKLEQWAEDALTQGEQPQGYIWNLLRAAVLGDQEGEG